MVAFMNTCLELIQVFWNYQQLLCTFITIHESCELRIQWPVFLVTHAWQCYIYVTSFIALVIFVVFVWLLLERSLENKPRASQSCRFRFQICQRPVIAINISRDFIQSVQQNEEMLLQIRSRLPPSTVAEKTWFLYSMFTALDSVSN
jgi:hypothetical protein